MVGHQEQVAFFIPLCNPQYTENIKKSMLKAVKLKRS